jgi:hypothetical protein
VVVEATVLVATGDGTVDPSSSGIVVSSPAAPITQPPSKPIASIPAAVRMAVRRSILSCGRSVAGHSPSEDPSA